VSHGTAKRIGDLFSAHEKTLADESIHQQGLLVTSTFAVVVLSTCSCHLGIWRFQMAISNGVNREVVPIKI